MSTRRNLLNPGAKASKTHSCCLQTTKPLEEPPLWTVTILKRPIVEAKTHFSLLCTFYALFSSCDDLTLQSPANDLSLFLESRKWDGSKVYWNTVGASAKALTGSKSLMVFRVKRACTSFKQDPKYNSALKQSKRHVINIQQSQVPRLTETLTACWTKASKQASKLSAAKGCSLCWPDRGCCMVLPFGTGTKGRTQLKGIKKILCRIAMGSTGAFQSTLWQLQRLKIGQTLCRHGTSKAKNSTQGPGDHRAAMGMMPGSMIHEPSLVLSIWASGELLSIFQL